MDCTPSKRCDCCVNPVEFIEEIKEFNEKNKKESEKNSIKRR